MYVNKITYSIQGGRGEGGGSEKAMHISCGGEVSRLAAGWAAARLVASWVEVIWAATRRETAKWAAGRWMAAKWAVARRDMVRWAAVRWANGKHGSASMEVAPTRQGGEHSRVIGALSVRGDTAQKSGNSHRSGARTAEAVASAVASAAVASVAVASSVEMEMVAAGLVPGGEYV